jgi:site-specific DNA recombinase
VTTPPAKIRCAVYTRKSSEEGLDQSFNSLHAQREACEAYVLSQKHEGWEVVPGAYDDGGFSGGNMERPGLKKLLTDISAGLIDTIVVYKVDRLTRSLADFAKIVESFDKKGVSFVSVTQQFNTTSSMGRLTLNVLLSFAQFEREVTGERIRDKVAASKKKGMWMGGFVPLGYDNVNHQLVINPLEAEIVRGIFLRYLDLRSVTILQEELRDQGVRSKQRTTADGRQLGGAVLSRGTVYHLLSNPVYIGKTLHKGVLHPGKHEPILDLDLWNRAVDLLKHNRVNRKRTRNVPSGRVLLGLLKTPSGNMYTPTHSSKGGRRYFYYTLRASDTNAANRILRQLPATEIEDLTVEALRRFFADTAGLANHFGTLNIQEMQALSAAAKDRVLILSSVTLKEKNELIRRLICDVVVDDNLIQIRLSRRAIQNELLGDHCGQLEDLPIVLKEHFHVARRGSEARLILSDGRGTHEEPIPSLIGAIVQARTWAGWVISGKVVTLGELARKAGRSRQYTTRILRLASLSPELVDLIMRGDHPSALTVPQLTAKFPLQWERQSLA